MKKSSDALRVPSAPENPSDGARGAPHIPILGERFEFRPHGSLKVDFDARVIQFDPSDPNHLRRFERVLRQRLLQELEPTVSHFCGRLGVEVNRITIRKQRGRWGSCSSARNLNFNLRLICLPPELIRYVACHEVAHLRENNHSRAFWALVGREFENYRELKRRLTKHWSSVQGAIIFF